MRAKFLDGTIKIVADDWPSFLYEEGVYDPNEIDKGLLRGHFLLRVSFLAVVVLAGAKCCSGFSTSFYLAFLCAQGDGVYDKCHALWKRQITQHEKSYACNNCICSCTGMYLVPRLV
jgi:hypothetical protein